MGFTVLIATMYITIAKSTTLTSEGRTLINSNIDLVKQHLLYTQFIHLRHPGKATLLYILKQHKLSIMCKRTLHC